jgi:3-hydroxyisobutyrate dehydrogenase
MNVEKISPESTKVGWIGTGIMGKSMCGHILKAGYKVFAYNRTREKAKELIDQGATWCDSPKDVAKNSEIIFSIVGYPKDVREIYFGEMGIFAGAKKDSILVDMTTSEPSLAKEINQQAKKLGMNSLDAPVSGGDIGAREARLSIMVGGDKEVFEKIKPLFQLMGQTIAYTGEASSGQHTKMCNQILIAGNMIGMVECLLYAYSSGLDLDEVISVVGKGAAASWAINNIGPKIIQRNFDPGFYVEHFVKDMGIALEEAKRMALKLPGLELVNQLYISLVKDGKGRLGTQSLVLALEKLNKIEIKKKKV